MIKNVKRFFINQNSLILALVSQPQHQLVKWYFAVQQTGTIAQWIFGAMLALNQKQHYVVPEVIGNLFSLNFLITQ